MKYISNCVWNHENWYAVSNSSVYSMKSLDSPHKKNYFSLSEEDSHDFKWHHYTNDMLASKILCSHTDTVGIVSMKFDAVTEISVCYVVHLPSQYNDIIVWKETLCSQESAL